MADVSVGVIGIGRMGSCHAANVHSYVKGARVAAIYDLDQARARQVAAIQSLHSGTLVAVSTPTRLGFYQERELKGEARVD